jgi:hypothetical protein
MLDLEDLQAAMRSGEPLALRVTPIRMREVQGPRRGNELWVEVQAPPPDPEFEYQAKSIVVSARDLAAWSVPA